MKESNSKSSGGIGLCSLLFLIFLTLKLCGVITWSWWWITSPLWGPVAILLFILAVIFICAFIYHTIFIKGKK
jgi:hypothetical protein